MKLDEQLRKEIKKGLQKALFLGVAGGSSVTAIILSALLCQQKDRYEQDKIIAQTQIESLENENKELEYHLQQVISEKQSQKDQIKILLTRRIYRKEELLLAVDNATKEPSYHFILKTNYLMDGNIEEQCKLFSNGVSYDFEVNNQDYFYITNAEESFSTFMCGYMGYADSSFWLEGYVGTVFLESSSCISNNDYEINAIIKDFPLPDEYQNKITFTYQELKEIEEIYNTVYNWQNAWTDKEYDIEHLSLIKYGDKYIFVRNSELNDDRNLESFRGYSVDYDLYRHQYTTIYPCITNQQIGLTYYANGKWKLTSNNDSLQRELDKACEEEFLVYSDITVILSPEQLQSKKLTYQQIEELENTLNRVSTKKLVIEDQ